MYTPPLSLPKDIITPCLLRLPLVLFNVLLGIRSTESSRDQMLT